LAGATGAAAGAAAGAGRGASANAQPIVATSAAIATENLFAFMYLREVA
jgi:hypothetical protein